MNTAKKIVGLRALAATLLRGKSACFLVIWTTLIVRSTSAHDLITTKITYSREIARILAKRCVSCHGIDASIPLTAYKQVRPWAVDIKDQVLTRQMPPWGAVKGFGNLAFDNGLTQEELLTIAFWAIGGAPEGDPTTLPQSKVVQLNPEAVPLHDALMVSQSKRLATALLLAGIRPETLAEIRTARVLAILPNGRKQPLLWLFHFDPKWKQVFRLREPLLLPAGSVVESDVPLQFALETQ